MISKGWSDGVERILGKPMLSKMDKLILRDRNVCQYCLINIKHGHTRDHLRPLALGGSNHVNNLVLACASCNQRKADMLPLEYIAWQAGWKNLRLVREMRELEHHVRILQKQIARIKEKLHAG